MTTHTPFGLQGEEFAIKYLKNKGYKVVERNFHSRFGEIDIICLKDNSIIFVEVKSRNNFAFGRPIESVNSSKLSKIVKTAQYFMLKQKKLPQNMRFDVIEVFLDNGQYKIEHTQNITL